MWKHLRLWGHDESPIAWSHVTRQVLPVIVRFFATAAIVVAVGLSARSANAASADQFDPPQTVTVQGYRGDAMEPFISRDGSTLFFNNLNEESQNTDIHYARKINPLTFRYAGRVARINTKALEGVPTMDKDGNFYFVSPRSYVTDSSTLFGGHYLGGSVPYAALLQGDVSRRKSLWFNMDLEISADGKTLYFTDNHKSLNGAMDFSQLAIAHKTAPGVFERDPRSDDIMRSINLEGVWTYAAGISEDELTLYFTRVVPVGKAPGIFVATRSSKTEFFGTPQHIGAIQGFVEGATVAPGGCEIYFHKKVGNTFNLFLAHKTGCN